MPYRVVVRSSLRRYIDRLPRRLREGVLRRLEALGQEPRPGDSRSLQGATFAGQRRVPVGDLRVLYTVNDTALVVEIVSVGPRGDVYGQRR